MPDSDQDEVQYVTPSGRMMVPDLVILAAMMTVATLATNAAGGFCNVIFGLLLIATVATALVAHIGCID